MMKLLLIEDEQELAKSIQEYLNGNEFVDLLLDYKYLTKEQIVICLGITINGDKLLLGFMQTTSENTV